MTASNASVTASRSPGPAAPDSDAGLPSSPPLFGVLIFAALVIACAGLREVQSIVGPVFLVLTLVITVHPLRVVLVRHKWPQPLASVVAMIAMFALLIIVIGATVWSLTVLIQTLTTYGGRFTTLYNDTLEQLGRIGVDQQFIDNAIAQLNVGSFTGVAQTVLNTITSGASLLALMIAMVFFLAFDAAGIGDRIALIRLERPSVADALVHFAQSVRKYWIVTTVFGFIVAVLDVVALLIIGVPMAFTWGVLAFVTNFIPNVGFIIGVIPPTLIALLEGGPGPAIATAIVYLAINVIVQTLIQPRFTGDAVGITATVAFLSLIFWAFLLGPLGALLAVPATLMVKVLLIDHSRSGRWFGALINSTPAGADDSRPGIGRAGHSEGEAEDDATDDPDSGPADAPAGSPPPGEQQEHGTEQQQSAP